jgi:hypothetical protein
MTFTIDRQDNTRLANQDAERARVSRAGDTTAQFSSRPMHLRPGIASPAQQDAMAAEARARREAPASPQVIAQSFGISRDFALAWGRMEAQIVELKQEVASLKQAIYNQEPAHLRDMERRTV